jgi:hypothetical protein
MNVPTVALPPRWRAVAYYASVALGLGLLTAKAVLVAYGLGDPPWYNVIQEVLPAWLAAFGLTAATNLVIPEKQDDELDDGPSTLRSGAIGLPSHLQRPQTDHAIHQVDPHRTGTDPERAKLD